MNKKIVFLILLIAITVAPLVSLAAANDKTLGFYATKVKSTAISIATPIVVIGWVVAGILYLTAAGAPDKINLAKGAVKACVIGTVLVVLAMGSTAIVDVIRNAFGLPEASDTTGDSGSSVKSYTDNNGNQVTETTNPNGSKTITTCSGS